MANQGKSIDEISQTTGMTKGKLSLLLSIMEEPKIHFKNMLTTLNILNMIIKIHVQF